MLSTSRSTSQSSSRETIQSLHPWENDDLEFDLDSGNDPPFIELDHYPNQPVPVPGDSDLDALLRDPDNPNQRTHPELDQHLFRARDLLPDASTTLDENPDLFPTQLGEPDLLLGGGIARGEMIEIIGRRTSGRFSLVLSTLAAATRRGESAALVDLGDHLDPQSAEICGIDLERLLWLRPRHMKEAVGCAELLLGAGFALVVLDLGMPPVPGGRGIESAWLRLARNAQAHCGALLVSAPYRMSGTAAQAVLELLPAGRGSSHSPSWKRRQLIQWLGKGRSPRLLGGFVSQLALQKARTHRLKKNSPQALSARVSLRAERDTVFLDPISSPTKAQSPDANSDVKPDTSPSTRKPFATPTIERFRQQHPDSSSWTSKHKPRPVISETLRPAAKQRHAS